MEPDLNTARVHLSVHGRVQGVSFRYYMLEQAIQMGVFGWVRNLWDGRVEAVIEGDPEKVRRMVDWCRKGPPAAIVEDIEITWEDNPEGFEDFSIRATGREL